LYRCAFGAVNQVNGREILLVRICVLQIEAVHQVQQFAENILSINQNIRASFLHVSLHFSGEEIQIAKDLVQQNFTITHRITIPSQFSTLYYLFIGKSI
jgi:hypothetical protein